jgi:transposase
MGDITMSRKELNRVEIIQKAVEKRISQKVAAEQLGLSTRQVIRLVKRVRSKGVSGLCHRLRGKPPNRQITPEFEQKVIERYKERYWDFGPTFAQEKLKTDDLVISRESLRKLLIKNQLWVVRKNRDKTVHVWRERRSCEGDLVQADGSHHRWLEERLDQEFCLMGFIDDASGKIFGKFYEYEGVYPILDSVQDYTLKSGRPRAIYIDRHSTYKSNRKASIDDQLDGNESKTQFEQVMQELDIEVIHARSPQAKGRVERLFGTLQDRLIKEMRLANICTIEAANQFLEGYLHTFNEKFSVEPKSTETVWRALPQNIDLEHVFSRRFKRIILNDYTIQFQKQLFLIKNPSLGLKKQPVEIRESLTGKLTFHTKSKALSVKLVQKAPKKAEKMSMSEARKRLSQACQSETKSKKSWMDDFYIGKQHKALVGATT